MNAADILKDLARRPMEALSYSQENITPENLNAHPGGHDNSIAWLLWHTGREIDVQLAALTGEKQVWTAQGFREKFGLGLADDDLGFGHSAEQARAIVVEDKDLLISYVRAAVEAQVAYVETLDDAALEEIVDENWDPPVTRAARLISISADAVQHVAQAAYVTGMDV